jgi:hypothetical protein
VKTAEIYQAMNGIKNLEYKNKELKEKKDK